MLTSLLRTHSNHSNHSNHSTFFVFYLLFDLKPSASTYQAAVPTIENSIGRTPLHDDLSIAKSSIHSTYEPSSQEGDKYFIAEKIQNALRQPPAHTQVSQL